MRSKGRSKNYRDRLGSNIPDEHGEGARLANLAAALASSLHAASLTDEPNKSEAKQHSIHLLDILGGFEGRKIVSGNGFMMVFDFDMHGGEVTSTSREEALQILERTYRIGGITLRQFTADTDKETGFPIKNLYGYRVFNGEITRLTPEEVEEAHNTDATTGKRLPREPDVRYC